jgi:putative membrane protein
MSDTVSVVLLVAAAALGCSRGEPARSSNDAQPAPGMTPASGLVVAKRDLSAERAEQRERLDDAQVIGAARAINALEVDQAKLAIGRARNERVKEFASRLIAEHGRADKELAELERTLGLAPSDSGTATELRVAAAAAENELSEASGASFDKLFLKEQVDMHERVLEAFDAALVPHAGHPELKRVLQRLRPQVAAHLETARGLRDELD